MNAILPPRRPRISLGEILLMAQGRRPGDRVCLVGIRGYYLDTMGEPGKNDRGIYDDAIAICAPDRLVTFNANCDPALHMKGIANLKAGVYRYKLGIHGITRPKHQQYRALVQDDDVTIIRDGEGERKGFFGINIHRGGYQSVSSLGCQTVFPTQWVEFFSAVEGLMRDYAQTTISYILVENTG